MRTTKQLADVLTKATTKGTFDCMIDTLTGQTGLDFWFSDSTDAKVEFYASDDEELDVDSDSG